MERKVSIKVNGKRVPTNKFVHQIMENIIVGIVDALHDTDADGTIEIKVEPRPLNKDEANTTMT
ncbi:MAG: hypothetical protein U5P10_15300 [Spirochaetia bacterium]|nr:hypothetical protein [Spirochaetia bacterium]